MIERSQDSSLVTKAAQDEICVHAALDNLDGDASLESIVVALAQINRSHAAATYLALYFVSAQSLAYEHVALIL
jgi:hypothetical protein